MGRNRVLGGFLAFSLLTLATFGEATIKYPKSESEAKTTIQSFNFLKQDQLIDVRDEKQIKSALVAICILPSGTIFKIWLSEEKSISISKITSRTTNGVLQFRSIRRNFTSEYIAEEFFEFLGKEMMGAFKRHQIPQFPDNLSKFAMLDIRSYGIKLRGALFLKKKALEDPDTRAFFEIKESDIPYGNLPKSNDEAIVQLAGLKSLGVELLDESDELPIATSSTDKDDHQVNQSDGFILVGIGYINGEAIAIRTDGFYVYVHRVMPMYVEHVLGVYNFLVRIDDPIDRAFSRSLPEEAIKFQYEQAKFLKLNETSEGISMNDKPFILNEGAKNPRLRKMLNLAPVVTEKENGNSSPSHSAAR